MILIFASSLVSQVTENKPNAKLKNSEVANDLQKKKNVVAEVDLNNIVSLNKSGDASLSIPIVNVKSRTMNFPIQVNYQAGIKPSQKSSEVGLGWNISFGSIVRDYGAFEPDYTATTAEVDMLNSEGSIIPPGLLSMTSSASPMSPFSNNKNLLYNGIDAGNLTPDNYHISIPGLGSNTFWNNGTNGGPLDFVLTEFAPWKIGFDKKTYEIEQEFSRINEQNHNGFTDGFGVHHLTDDYRNLASAIGIPPYVPNRYFKKLVIGENGAPSVGFAKANQILSSNPDDYKVRYEDFKSFIITSEDGTQYVFGRGLRGQKYLFTEDPFWSTIPLSYKDVVDGPPGGGGGMGPEANAVYGEFWKIDYIAEWLLTEIRSADYVDSNSNGIADDQDAGDWVRIEYTEATQREEVPGLGSFSVPAHREWLNFSQTDKYSSLMRERAYVTRIVTPVQEVDFTSSQKYDVDHDYFETPLNYIHNFEYVYADPANVAGDLLTIKYPVETKKYDNVIVKERMTDKILNTIVFNYAAKGSTKELAVSNYLIRNNADAETVPFNPAHTGSLFNISNYLVSASGYGVGRGKTTLLGIDFFPENNLTTTDKKSYKFDYDFNPSLGEIHKHEIHKAAAYPTLRQSAKIERYKDENLPLSIVPYYAQEFDYLGNETVFNNTLVLEDEMGNYYDPSAPNNGRNAWSLSKLTIPTGGSIELEYENDNFDVVTDRTAWIANSSLVDLGLPNVVNYNRIALIRSMVQSKQNYGYTDINPKLLYRTFNMSMNAQSGGLRLKKKTVKDGINLPIVVNYSYGTGHYSSVPASYWENYLSAFSSFMSREQQRHTHEVYKMDLLMYPGFFDNDFATYMAELSFNSRIDNTLSDNHYYTFIDEMNADGSKTRSNYGDPLSSGSVHYDFQTQAFLKGYIRKDLNLIITNDVDARHNIKLLKTENFSNTSTLISSSETNYSFDLKTPDKKISFKAMTLPSHAYPVYIHDYSGIHAWGDLVIMSDIPTGYFYASNLLSLGNLVVWPFLNINNPNHFIDLVDDMAAYTSSGTISSTRDTDYQLFASNLTRQQSIFTKVDAVTENYKGIVSKTEYSYLANGLLKSTIKYNSEKNNPGFTIPSSERMVTENIYAHEAYFGITSQFINKNMLSQKAAVNTGVISTAPLAIAYSSSSIQTWTNATDPKPDRSYVYNAPIAANGGLTSGSPLPFDYSYGAINDPKWQEENALINVNKFGQGKVSLDNNVYTRNVWGYNSETVKATIQFPDKYFDATYTGFEDLYDFDKTVEVSGGFMLVTAGGSCSIAPPGIGLNFKYYVDNTTGLFNINDDVIVYPNPNINTCWPITGGWITAPFKTKIENISASTFPGTTISTCYGGTGLPDLTNNTTILCFNDAIPGIYFNPVGSKISKLQKTPYLPIESDLDEFWYNINADNRSKVNNAGRTGTKAFYLASRINSSKPNQKTPVRPVHVEKALVSTPMPYIASCWIRTNRIGPHGGPPIPGASTLMLSYTVWNEARTTVLYSGSTPISGLTNQWNYFEIEIPVTQISNGQWLDVMVENSTIITSTSEKIYVDDMLIYPKGAKYEYNSCDKFLNITHMTDANDRTVTNTYDNWARVSRTYDANNQLTKQFKYFTTANILANHNYEEVQTFIDGSAFNKTRQYFDGIGKLKQTAINEPSHDRKLVSTIDYDNQGRPIKQYNTLGVSGQTFGNKIVSGYAASLQAIYGSPYTYVQTEYKGEPGSTVSKLHRQHTLSEADVYKEFTDGGNLLSELNFLGISYNDNELLKQTQIDEDGNVTETFKDKVGQTIASRTAIGVPYTFDASGAIVWGSGTIDYATTYFIYDLAGHLVKTIDPENKATEYFYNSANQMIKEIHPDKGTIEYRYDSFGRLRFRKDNSDKDAITSGLFADIFTYNKYDVWGRLLESGKEKIATGGTVIFDNDSFINDGEYPLPTSAGVEIHKQWVYDNSKTDNTINRVSKDRALSGHYLSGTVYIANETDENTYTYTNNGQVSTKTFNFSGLSQLQQLTYTYNRGGLPITTQYKNLSEPLYDFIETISYDDMGRIKESQSGKNILTLLPDASYKYDAMGNLLVKSVCENTGNPADPFREYIANNYNIRGEQTLQIAKNFRYKLDYDKRGNINSQTWSNNYFDNTASTTPFVQHKYDYYYDAMNRLTGANYMEVNSTNDPYSNYPNSILIPQDDFICGPYIPDLFAVKSALGTIKEYSSITTINQRLLQIDSTLTDSLAVDVIIMDSLSMTGNLIKQISASIDSVYSVPLDSLIVSDPSPSISKLTQISTYTKQNFDISSKFEKDIRRVISHPKWTHQQKINKINAKKDSLKLVDKDPQIIIYVKQSYDDIIKFIEQNLSRSDLTLEQKLLAIDRYLGILETDLSISHDLVLTIDKVFIPIICIINTPATALNPLDDPLIGLTYPAVGRKYDNEYYYSKVGNFNQLNRYDDNALLTSQGYTYPVVNNQLSNVSFYEPSGSTVSNYTYDTNGNLTADSRSNLTSIVYNPYNMPVEAQKVGGFDTRYRYDIGNQRSVKTLPSLLQEFYVGNVVVAETGKPKQYHINSGYVELDNANNLIRKYSINDWLGTTRTIIDEAGGIVSSRDHYPFGKIMPMREFESDLEGKRFQFTGQELDPETGYDYFDARYYSRELGRFLSTDPMLDERIGLTPYNYVQNNPINRIDPTGAKDIIRIDTKKKRVDVTTNKDEKDQVILDGKYAGEFSKTESQKITTAHGYRVTVHPEDPKQKDAVGMGATDAVASWVAGGVVFKLLGAGLKGLWAINASRTATTGSNVVYVSVEAGVTKYVGITNNLARRAAEHLTAKGIRIEPLMQGLSRTDARAVEQALIEIHGLGKNGGTLLNKINSIAITNPSYGAQLQRGYDLLKSIGY